MTQMRRLAEVAELIRSKNAGPFRLTLDIIFRTFDDYRRVRESNSITPELVARLYCIPISDITNFVTYDPGKAIKITLRRAISSGSVGDTDVYGSQQHALLLDIQVPWK